MFSVLLIPLYSSTEDEHKAQLKIITNEVNTKQCEKSSKRSAASLVMFLLCTAVFIASLAIGTVLGYPSVAVESMLTGAPFGCPVGLAMSNPSNVAWFNSIMALSALLGAIVAGKFTLDK